MRAAFRAAALAAALCFCPAALVHANDDATLTARGGGLAISGRLVAHDGMTYRIDTEWGRLTVDATAVDCAGPGCPDLTRFAPELRLALEPWLATHLLVPLAESFARAEGLRLSRDDDDRIWEFEREGRVELRLRLLALSGGAAAILAAGDADAALAVAETGRLVARLPLALATAMDAPAGALSLEALRDLRRRGGDWRGLLPGADQPLAWHATPAGGVIEAGAAAALGPLAVAAERSAATPAALAEGLARDPWGLAVLPLPLPAGLMPRDLAESCGLRPDLSPFAAAAGEHPLTAAIQWLGTGRRLAPAAQAFAAHLTSPIAQRDLAAAGIPAPSPLRRQGLVAQGARLANALLADNPEITLPELRAALTGLRGAERLALSFRFDPRGSALDAEGRSALASLSDHLASGALRGHEVLLLGFSDARGPAAGNRDLSRQRAEAVLAALRAATPDLPAETLLRAEGMGEIMPLTCDDSVEGRTLNRRVEVWIRAR